MVISGRLNSNDIRRMADEVINYGTNLKDKIRTFTSRLADKGILAAIASGGRFDKYLIFSKQSDIDGTIIVASETSIITAKWLKYGHKVEAKVSPLLMAEFGAGPHAIIWEGLNGNTNILPDGTEIGRGSFPPNESGDYFGPEHADESSWWYMDLDGEWHQARGVKPTRPIHNAVLEIIAQIESTAREVFGNGAD